MKLNEIKKDLKGYFIYKNKQDYELGLKEGDNFKLITDNVNYLSFKERFTLTPIRYLLIQVNNNLLDPLTYVDDLADVIPVIDFDNDDIAFVLSNISCASSLDNPGLSEYVIILLIRSSALLKGSKEKRVLELELNQCPSYGYYQALRVEEVGQKVDWMIRNDYLRIQYDYHLPMIVFSPKGWEIEKRNYAAEVYEDFCKAAKEQNENIIEQLKEHTNRQVVLIVLDLLRERGDASLIPILEEWKAVEVKKIRDGIGDVISAIEDR